MGGTRIGHALQAVARKLRHNAAGDRMVILISDGESADLGGGAAQKIGEELRSDNTTVFYIHVAEGQPQAETFTLASLTGGHAFVADDPAALSDVFRRIDEMKPAKLKPSAPDRADWYWPFAVAGLSLTTLQVVSALRFRFTPW